MWKEILLSQKNFGVCLIFYLMKSQSKVQIRTYSHKDYPWFYRWMCTGLLQWRWHWLLWWGRRIWIFLWFHTLSPWRGLLHGRRLLCSPMWQKCRQRLFLRSDLETPKGKKQRFFQGHFFAINPQAWELRLQLLSFWSRVFTILSKRNGTNFEGNFLKFCNKLVTYF